ncbi:MAG: hypothetical protein GWP19_06615 [Planctomycetia bacterium]|nr:hypothetical protein [Planctomycetia bacterium]
MIKRTFLTFIVIFLFFCNKPTGPIIPDVTTTKDDLSNFQTIIADYDSVVFKSNDDLLLLKKDVVEIILGTKDNYVFEPIQTIVPVFSEINNKYRLDFEIPAKVDEKTYLKFYMLRFVMTDDSFFEIDVPAYFYKYPYENAEIFLDSEEFESFTWWIDDFDIVGNVMYYHPSGAVGLFKYNLGTKQSSNELHGYSGGEFIAANEDFVFCDELGILISKYNISIGSVESQLSLLSDSPEIIPEIENSELYIGGLTIYGNYLYIILNRYNDGGSILAKYDFDFNLIEHDELGTSAINIFYSSAYGGVFFLIEWSTRKILRYDLTSKLFLESKPLPTIDIAGLDVHGGRLYYGSWIQQAIFSIPLNDLMN